MARGSALLLARIRAEVNGSRTSCPAPADGEWTEIVRLALRHGVAGLLCRRLVHDEPGGVPADILDAARAYLNSLRSTGDAVIAELSALVTRLESAGIAVMPFKGPVLGLAAYGDPTIRPSGDLDLLVPWPKMCAAVTILEDLGYASLVELPPQRMRAYYRINGQDMLLAPDKVTVEPHWSFAPSTLAFDLDMDALWQRSTTVVLEGQTLRSLTVEDTLLHLCLHGAKEGWWRLLGIADIAALIASSPDLDWEALVRRASDAGLRRILLLGLALARDLLDTALPGKMSKMIDDDATCGELAAEAGNSLFDPARRPESWSLYRLSGYFLRLRERRIDRLRYLLRTITTPRPMHYRMVNLPERLSSGYVAVKIAHDYAALPLWRMGKRLLGKPEAVNGTTGSTP